MDFHQCVCRIHNSWSVLHWPGRHITRIRNQFLQHHPDRHIHPRGSFQEGATEHEKPGRKHQGDWYPSLRWRYTSDKPLQRQGAASVAYQHRRVPPKARRSCVWAPQYAWNRPAHHQLLEPCRLVHSAGSDAESVPLQVLVDSLYMLTGEHPNSNCRGRNEQREGDVATQMEHELAHDCVLGDTQYCCEVRNDFMGRHTARAHLPVNVLCCVSVLHYYP